MSPDGGLALRYRAVLHSYLGGGGETALQSAYELGRMALESGLGPLVLFSIHRDTVEDLPRRSLTSAEFAERVTTVLIEALAPYEMTYAAVDSARGVAQQLGGLLADYASEASEASGADAAAIARRHLTDLEAVRGRLDGVWNTTTARRGLIADIVGAQEQERRRIATEIHDDAVQVMAAVALQIGLLRRTLTDPSQIAACADLEGVVAESTANLRRLIAGLHPAELDHVGLVAAVTSALMSFTADFEIEHRIETNLPVEPDPDVRMTVFRILSEALANVRKHARASRVDVLVTARDGGVLTRVGDDGVGFDPAAEGAGRRTGHIGLSAMQERADLAGGWLHITSGDGGTTIEYWIPAN
jgi:signal transduction histidine kinase